MKESIRLKIEAARTSNRPAPPEEYNPSLVAKAIAERVVDGERLYTLKEAATLCKMDPTTALRRLKGRPGFLQFVERGPVSITESLVKAFIAEAAARGLASS
jgi:hypothetical protein